MRILIVEDEASIALRIERMLLQATEGKKAVVKTASTFGIAKAYLQDNTIDLMLLDLNLNGISGFQLLKDAVSGSFQTIVISAYQEKAIEAFEYGVLDFVCKPFTYERLKKAIDRFESKEAASNTVKYLAVKMQGQIKLIKPSEVKYIKASGNYAQLCLEDNTRLLHDKSLEGLETILQPAFHRIHKSYLVRFDKIKKLHYGSGSKYEIELIDGELIPIGRTRLKTLKEALLK